MTLYSAGSVIAFTYYGRRAHTKHPKVFVVHPNWENLCHGIAIHNLNEQEINLIRQYVYEKRTADKPQYTFKNITPLDVYQNLIVNNPRLRGNYRTYIPKQMNGVVVLRKRL